MIPALFLLGGLIIATGIFVYAHHVTAVEDAEVDWDAPIDYYPNDHPGWSALAEAVNAERSADWEEHVADALDVANVFTQAEIDRLRAIAAADAAKAVKR